MTNQEAFDKVWQWFVVKGHGPSVDATGCAYRGDGGARCAAGVLIPNRLYRRKMEDSPIGAVCDDYEPVAVLLSGVRSIVADMQGAHDNCAYSPSFGEAMSSRLKQIAEKYGLLIPITEGSKLA